MLHSSSQLSNQHESSNQTHSRNLQVSLGRRWRKKIQLRAKLILVVGRGCLFPVIVLQEFGIISSTAKGKPTRRLNSSFKQGLTFSFLVKELLSHWGETAGSKFSITEPSTRTAWGRERLYVLPSSSRFFFQSALQMMLIHTSGNGSRRHSPLDILSSPQAEPHWLPTLLSSTGAAILGCSLTPLAVSAAQLSKLSTTGGSRGAPVSTCELSQPSTKPLNLRGVWAAFWHGLWR